MKILGILASIFHLLLFTYIYLTSINYLSIEDFTLSSAFQYCDKIGSVSLLIITSMILVMFLKNEGHLENGTMKYLFISIFFIWLLFFTEHENHKFFAFVGLLIIILIPYAIYHKNKNEDLFRASNMCSLCVIFTCLLSVCEYFSEYHEYFRFLFACMEAVLVFVYFLFLVTLSNL